MAYNVTLEGKNKQIAERMLEKVCSILHACQIKYWLEGGTLLGIRRENRLLPWDNDIDLSIMSNQITKFDALFKSLQKAGFRVRTRKFKTSSKFFNQGEIRIIKIREKRFLGLTKGPVCLEIFVKYQHDENCYWEIANKTKCVPCKFYSSFKTITFKNFNYSIPEKTDDYLTYRYGDWKTQVKNWDTVNDDRALT
ncbi:LicD family protein [uncultured Planktosalinus sp.]|uniref:LicD family protein n=1 Tax=uncultured Planktosalinus sp. TaxID=1810935 RepID=UPI0030DA204B